MTSQMIVALSVALTAVLVMTQVLGALARRLGQPAVVGEILGGVLVGPTLFGGAISAALFPAEIRPSLTALADIGMILFLFVVGLELGSARHVRDAGATTCAVAVSSMVVPFVLGCGLAAALAVLRGTPLTPAYVLFVGAAMAATALPVLARILADQGVLGSRIGRLALSSAVLVDVLTWSLLAVVVAIGGGAPPWRLLTIVPYVAIVLGVVRPALRLLAGRAGGSDRLVFVAVLGGLLLSAAATEWMGLHFIFGAFLFGVVMPKGDGDRLREAARSRLEPIASVLLLPIYFVVAGLQVDLSGITAADAVTLVAVVTTAVVGKFAGTYLAARLRRIPARSACVLSTLMNTRGLTELVILTVGLQSGLIDRRLYSIMVVMALVTTAMTGILLRRIGPAPEPADDRAAIPVDELAKSRG